MSGSLNVGLRMMISREGFERTGLMQLGSRAAERYLFKIEPNGPSMEDAKSAILDALPEARVIDSRESNPLITRGLDQATTFLSLISLIALIVGAIGVGMAMYAHLQQKMDNIAVMKSLGATSGEIIRIYTIQTLMLGLLGGIAGVLLGRAVEEVFPSLINKIFEIKATTGWHFDAAIQGIVTGLLTTLLFTLPPLVAIRKIRPAMILRRGMADQKLPLRGRLAAAREAVVLGGIILLGLGGIAGWLGGSAKVGGYFAGGLFFSLIALAAVAALLLRLLRVFLRRLTGAHPVDRPAGLGESLSPGQPGAIDSGRHGPGRDVHVDGLSDPELAGQRNHPDGSAGRAQCLSGWRDPEQSQPLTAADLQAGWHSHRAAALSVGVRAAGRRSMGRISPPAPCKVSARRYSNTRS